MTHPDCNTYLAFSAGSNCCSDWRGAEGEAHGPPGVVPGPEIDPQGWGSTLRVQDRRILEPKIPANFESRSDFGTFHCKILHRPSAKFQKFGGFSIFHRHLTIWREFHANLEKFHEFK